MSNRSVAILLTVAMLVPVLGPLSGLATAATRTDGDVIINGAFHDARLEGHPLKYYGDEFIDGSGPQERRNEFIAYDWTTPIGNASYLNVTDDGLLMAPRAGVGYFVQQHFAGSGAPQREMRFSGITVDAAGVGGSTSIRVDLRGGGVPDGMVSHTISLSTTSTSTFLSASSLGVDSSAPIKLNSVRVWINGPSAALIERVQVFATNGIEPRAIFIGAGGDDTVTTAGGAMTHGPGADGAYTWILKIVDERGDGFPVENGVLCVYPFEGFPSDNFSTSGGTCPSAILNSAESGAYRTVLEDAVRFDVPASEIAPTGAAPHGFVVWGSLEIDATSGGLYAPHNEVWWGGWLNAAQATLVEQRSAAASSNLSEMPSAVFFDRDSNGLADGVQSDETDGHAVIVTPVDPVGTTLSPLTLLRPDANGEFQFDVQVFGYGLVAGAAMPLRTTPSGFKLVLFDGASIANNPSGFWKEQPTLWESDATDVVALDATTYRVTVPAADLFAPEGGSTLVGAWAYYNVDGGDSSSVLFTNDAASDFHSTLQNAAKELRVADALRGHATPILLTTEAGLPADKPTVLVRVADSESYQPVPGGLALNDFDGDGSLTFEYTMLLPSLVPSAPSTGSRALVVYDAAGAASDEFTPGTNEFAHAEFVASGTAQADGWIRVDVPLSSLENVKGPIGVYAYINDANGFNRYTWFSTTKALAAELSSGAADVMSDLATPIVVTETSGNVPSALLHALLGAPSLVSLTNPVVNPGFELDGFIEGAKDGSDATSGTMTSPPWFFRLDDNHATQQTNPYSTHEVATGKGKLGGNALRINLDSRDYGRGLMLGQLFAPDSGSKAYVWRNATSVSFDSAQGVGSGYLMQVGVRFKDAAGNIHASSGQVSIPNDGWRRATVTLTPPVEGQLLGLYLMPSFPGRTTIWLDNVQVHGAQLIAGEARSDLNDGYAMIIEPQGLVGDVQGVVSGAGGKFLLYNVSAIDYTSGGAALVDTSTVTGHAFALRTQDRQLANGELLRIRGDASQMVGVVALADAPQPAAAPWAFMDVGDVYYTFNQRDYPEQPVSGYYSPVKNALKSMTLADHLDYAATPVAYDGAREIANLTANQSLRLVTVTGGFGVLIAADTPFVETTNVTIGRVGAPNQTFLATIDSAQGTLVPGLVISADDINLVTVTSDATRFTRGDTIAAGAPSPSFEVCRFVDGACTTTFHSKDQLTFRSTTIVPSGETATLTWRFGDGTTSTSSDPIVKKTYQRPGVYTVNLTATTPSGRTDSIEQQVVVLNLAPSISGIDLPGPVFRDSQVVLQARAFDLDGGRLTYKWTIENVEVPTANGSRLELTPEVLYATTGLDTLVKGNYTVGLVAYDDQGGESLPSERNITIGDRAVTVLPPAATVLDATNASYALVGERVRIEATVVDLDNNVTSATAIFEHAGVETEMPLTLANATLGIWRTDVNTLPAGTYNLSVVGVNDIGETVQGLALPFEVRENAAPLANVSGPAVIDSFENATFSANGSLDPDARGPVTLEWFVDGQFVEAGPEFVYEAGGASGERIITLRVTDIGGAITEHNVTLGVDDALVMDVDIFVHDFRSGVEVTVALTDELGRPVPNATVQFADFFGPAFLTTMLTPGGVPTFTADRTTDENGVAVWHVPRIGQYQLPGEHHIIVRASAGSHAGAVVQDLETVRVETTYDVPLTP